MPYKVATRGMKAPFKWAGAKNRMFEKYMAKGFFPSGDPKVFVDMFAGTAIVGQWVAANYPNTTIVINETCGELVSMYRQMQRKNFPLFEAEYKRHVAMYSKLSIDDRKKIDNTDGNQYFNYNNNYFDNKNDDYIKIYVLDNIENILKYKESDLKYMINYIILGGLSLVIDEVKDVYDDFNFSF